MLSWSADEYFKQTTLLMHGRKHHNRQVTWYEMFGAHPFTYDLPRDDPSQIPADRDQAQFLYLGSGDHMVFLRKVQDALCHDDDKVRHCSLFIRKATVDFAASLFSLVAPLEASERAANFKTAADGKAAAA